MHTYIHTYTCIYITYVHKYTHTHTCTYNPPHTHTHIRTRYAHTHKPTSLLFLTNQSLTNPKNILTSGGSPRPGPKTPGIFITYHSFTRPKNILGYPDIRVTEGRAGKFPDFL